VEGAVLQRRTIGVDIDPVAVNVALAKTRNYDLTLVEHAVKEVLDRLGQIERSDEFYRSFMHRDVSDEDFQAIVANEGLEIPQIPNLRHWFRNYVVIDLARIKQVIDLHDSDERSKLLLQIVFASIIRNSSNADPVPVSGLEFTAYMRKRDVAGRLVNPFALFRGSARKALVAVSEWISALPEGAVEPRAVTGSAFALPDEIPQNFDAVITSPPYHNAVDYYRRHQLEMFWLAYTRTQAERLALLPNYIGRPGIARKNPLLSQPWCPSDLADQWERKIREKSLQRSNDFRHYVQAMKHVFDGLAGRLRRGAPAIFVLGQSQWQGESIPTEQLFAELAEPNFRLDDLLHYPVKNRYMSYTRHNDASIDVEHVIVLRRQ
jgi:hypothetical protein